MNKFLVYLFGRNNGQLLFGVFFVKRILTLDGKCDCGFADHRNRYQSSFRTRRRYYTKHTYITANHELVMRRYSVKRSDSLIPTLPSTSMNWKRTMTAFLAVIILCSYSILSPVFILLL